MVVGKTRRLEGNYSRNTAMKTFLALVMTALPLAVMAAPTQVLGIPFNGKLKHSPGICPLNNEKAEQICWRSSPRMDDIGGRWGSAHLPDPDSRPLWAARGWFEIALKKDLTVMRIKVLAEGTERETIFQSISTRFGAPVSDDGRSARWVHKDAIIQLLCAAPTKCWATFNVPAAEADLAATTRLAQHQKPRPVTP